MSGSSDFLARHLGTFGQDSEVLLKTLGLSSLEELIAETIPQELRLKKPLALPPALGEHQALRELQAIAAKNVVARSYIGAGYYGTHTPAVILRNILQNPGWYTAYTPYQAEISQGRLEALLNYQTLIADLTGLPVANASLLDEATAAAEAMVLVRNAQRAEAKSAFFVADHCHPQTIAVVRTRATALGIEVIVGDWRTFRFERPCFGVLVQNPATDGTVADFAEFFKAAHAAKAAVVVASDLLALTMLEAPGTYGADVVLGSSQRFGVPMGFGGPHAAFLATRADYTRSLPGRLIGVSRDASGALALRMALQTREQHIRRERATSNICTAQVLLAVIASMYAVYHGPKGLTAIARRVHTYARRLARALATGGWTLASDEFFDTLTVVAPAAKLDQVFAAALAKGINLRRLAKDRLSVALDETVEDKDYADLLEIFAAADLGAEPGADSSLLKRKTPFLTHPVFHRYHTEHEMLRYLKSLENKDFSLTHGMIPLGSCTMKLNAVSEMEPVTWPGFGALHPFAPQEQWRGYAELIDQLASWLSELTGLPGCSLMPNSGAQGEYAGLLVIRRYQEVRGQAQRRICLIPASAHGTNPASAALAGLEVVVVATDASGNIDVADLRRKIAEHRDALAALMVTYPSTHGVFESTIVECCSLVHEAGGQVYLDGANMNAQVGLCRPGDYGADVCHLNLHKTFAIPHGGGGPGMGPICVAEHLKPYLPSHPALPGAPPTAVGPVSASPFGSASVLTISWMYIRMMGADGLRACSIAAILHANYIARRLGDVYPVLYRGAQGRVAHECILDVRPLKARAGVDAEDVSKRLMDYGFHAPTLSFPVAGTLMVEPTESESKAELDRFCEALLAIHAEAEEIARGEAPRDVNLLKCAPHSAEIVCADTWNRPYGRTRAAFPTAATRKRKFWPTVSRVDNVYGDRTLVATRPSEFE